MKKHAACNRQQGRRSTLYPVFLLCVFVLAAVFVSVVHGSGTFQQSKHGGALGVTNGARRPPNTPAGYATISATDFPAGSCNHCHDQHSSYTSSGTTYTHATQDYLLFDTLTSNTFCFGCHDDTAQTYTFPAGSNHDLFGANTKYYWFKGSAGNATYTGFNTTKHATDTRTTYNTWQGNSMYPANQWPSAPGRCINCHDPHGSPLGANLGGASTNGSTPSNRALLEYQINDNNPEDRNKLCYSCHDKIVKDNAQTTTNQQKFQGSEGFFQNGFKYIAHGKSDNMYWPGTNTRTEQWGGTTYTINNGVAPLPYWEARPQSDHGLCLNCHNPHTYTKTANNPSGVPFYLIDDYKATPDENTDVSSGSGNEWRVQLCIRCHSLTRLFTDAKSANDTHNQVNMKKQCNNCHNPHGFNPDAQYDNGTDTPRAVKTARAMVYFNSATITDSAGTPGSTGHWDPVNKSCKLTCSGTSHAPKTYKSSASLRQYNYRWYNDDAATPTTAKSPENTALLNAPTSGFYRLRLQIGEATGTSETTDFKLQYSKNGGTTWTDMAAQGAVTADWRYANSTFVADNGAVAALLLSATGLGTDGAGTYEEVTPTGSLAYANQSREFDFVIEPYSGLIQSDTRYIFRVIRSTAGTILTFYYNYPEVVTAAATVNLQQYNYRICKNDAATPGTFYAAQNTAYTLLAGEINDTIRLRIQLGNQSGGAITGQYFKLQYQRGQNLSWFDVGKSGDNVEDWEVADSAFISDKSVIASRVLTTAGLTMDNGFYDESQPTLSSDLANNTTYEHDFVLKTVQGKVYGGTAYKFRAISTNAQGTTTVPLAAYNNTPQITTPSLTAVLEQYNYRWYWDNTATDSALSIGANQNTALTNAQLAGNYRLRVQVGESNGGSTGAKYYKLKFATALGGPWTDLGAGVAWNYANGAAADAGTIQSFLLTQVDETNTHGRGTYEENNTMAAVTLQKEDREFDFAVVPVSGQVAASTTYYFRVYEATNTGADPGGTPTPLNTYNYTPQVTTAAAGKGYTEAAEKITVYNTNACGSISAANEIYPQWQSFPISTVITVRVDTTANAPATKTLKIFNYANTQQGATVNFAQAASPYCAQITVPATAGQYYIQVQLFGGAGSFYSDGPVITVGASQPQYAKTFSDSDYATESNAFAPGDRVYVQMNSLTAGTPALAQSSCNLVSFANATTATTLDDVRVVAGSDTSNYNVTFLMPASLTDGYWYALKCLVRTAAAGNLAVGTYKLIRYSSIRETRKELANAPPALEKLEAVPNPVYKGNAVKLYLTFKGAKENAWADVYVDEVKEENKKLSLAIPKERSDTLSFELDTKDFEDGSSHSVFVKARDGDEMRGAVLSVLPSQPSFPTGPQYTISYFRDENFLFPFETPGGVPLIDATEAHLRLNFITPVSFEPGIHVDAPFWDQDVEGGNLAPEGNLNYTYKINLYHEVKGVAKVAVGDAYGETLHEAQSGGMVNFFSTDGYYLSLSSAPEVIEADGKSQAKITAKAVSAKKKPVPGIALSFNRFQGGGTLQNLSAFTDANGEAQALYTAGLTADTAEIRVEDIKSGNAARAFLPLSIHAEAELTLYAPSAMAAKKMAQKYVVVLTAYPSSLPADGVSTSKIVARVFDAQEQKASGVPVVFNIVSGTGFLQSPAQTQTNEQGEAEVLYQAGNVPGEVVIRATQPDSGVESTITLTLTTGGPAKIYITAEPSELPADGISTSHIKVLVTNLFGTPLANVHVTLSLSSPDGTLSAESGQTDASGSFIATYTAGTIPEKLKMKAVVVSEKFK